MLLSGNEVVVDGDRVPSGKHMISSGAKETIINLFCQPINRKWYESRPGVNPILRTPDPDLACIAKQDSRLASTMATVQNNV